MTTNILVRSIPGSYKESRIIVLVLIEASTWDVGGEKDWSLQKKLPAWWS